MAPTTSDHRHLSAPAAGIMTAAELDEMGLMISHAQPAVSGSQLKDDQSASQLHRDTKDRSLALRATTCAIQRPNVWAQTLLFLRMLSNRHAEATISSRAS